MKKLIAFIVAVFFLGIMISVVLSVMSIIATVVVCILLGILIIKLFEIKLGYVMLILFLAIGVALEIIPEIVNNPIYIILSWCIFLLGIYFLAKDGKKSNAHR